MTRITSAPRPTAGAGGRSGDPVVLPRHRRARRWRGGAAARGAIALVWARHPRRRTTTTAPGWAWETPSMPIGPDPSRARTRSCTGEEAGARRRTPGRGEDRRRAHARPPPRAPLGAAGDAGACSTATASCADSARAASASSGWPTTSASSAPSRSSASRCTTTRTRRAPSARRCAAARLPHPGIVALYEAGRDDEAVYLVSELVRGRDARRAHARRRAVRPRRAARSASRCATRSPTPTAAASSTATSSPAT